MAYWNTRGLRGSAFEELIDLTNSLYQQKGIALVQKVPTPITPTAVDNKQRTITAAYFGKKSTVDYIGVAQGLAICFDAKETQQLSLPLKNIHQHQIEFMLEFEKQRGIAFFLVHFHTKSEVFCLPAQEAARHHANALSGGRKSIPYSSFNPEFIVQNIQGFPVHYLVAINKILATQNMS